MQAEHLPEPEDEDQVDEDRQDAEVAERGLAEEVGELHGRRSS